MNELHKALGDIGSIRRNMAQSTQFRGYGPATLAATSALAFLGAAGQALWLPDASHHLLTYLRLWFLVAVISAALTGTQMYLRTRRIHSGLSNEMIRMAVEQFLPSFGAGVLMTMVLERRVPWVLWMLPGLWQVIFSIGIFSSCRFLPKPIAYAGAWYLVTGLVCLSLGGERAFAPWTMGVPFGLGQLMVAGILLMATPEVEDEA
jgi:hypothetical protein